MIHIQEYIIIQVRLIRLLAHLIALRQVRLHTHHLQALAVDSPVAEAAGGGGGGGGGF